MKTMIACEKHTLPGKVFQRVLPGLSSLLTDPWLMVMRVVRNVDFSRSQFELAIPAVETFHDRMA